MNIEELFKKLAYFVAYFSEILAAIVIIVGMLQVTWKYIVNLLKRKATFNALISSRLKFGYSLSIGLGFLVGADIVKSAIIPSWDSIGQLAAIVIIRIVLNHFLMIDINQLKREEKTGTNVD